MQTWAIPVIYGLGWLQFTSYTPVVHEQEQAKKAEEPLPHPVIISSYYTPLNLNSKLFRIMSEPSVANTRIGLYRVIMGQGKGAIMNSDDYTRLRVSSTVCRQGWGCR